MLGTISALFRRQVIPPKALAGRHFVLDGTNIALLHGRKHPEMRYVLAICDYLSRNGGEYDCFFDANTGYIIQDHKPRQWVIFEQLAREDSGFKRFHVVPSGTEADQWILRRAKEIGAAVISNDRFRDRAKENRWIWKRRHSILIAQGHMTIVGLDAQFAVLPDPEVYLRRLLAL